MSNLDRIVARIGELNCTFDSALFPISVAAEAAHSGLEATRSWFKRPGLKIGPTDGLYPLGAEAGKRGQAQRLSLRTLTTTAAAAPSIRAGADVVAAFEEAKAWTWYSSSPPYSHREPLSLFDDDGTVLVCRENLSEVVPAGILGARWADLVFPPDDRRSAARLVYLDPIWSCVEHFCIEYLDRHHSSN